MTVSYTLVPIPIWSSFDLTGVAAGGASLYSWRSLDKTQPKAIYQDLAGQLPYTNPILFNENGEAPGQFYWADDELYYLQFFDSSGNLIWDADNYGPASAGGGGSETVTENLFVKNLITNGTFLYNSGSSTSPVGVTNLTLAPSNHDIYKPDIQFIKNNTAATDQITFPSFSLGSNALTGDVTPEVYLQYTCTGAGAGESQKCVQFPIVKHVQNLSNQVFTYSFWALGIANTQTITAFIYQDFGSGGTPSVVAPVSIQTYTLSNSWTQYVGSYTIPSVVGKTLGACGNDGLYFQLGFPLGVTSTVALTKPEFYLGNIDPASASLSPDFDSYDQTNAITNSPRTADIRTSINSFQPFGWVAMNDGTIGSASSNATTRANKDTFQLFNFLWSAMSSNQTYAPMYDNSGTATAYGANAIADFSANNQLSLPKSLGQAFAGTGAVPSAISYTADHTTNTLTVASSVSMGTGVPVILAGGTPPAGLSNGVVYYSINASSTTLQLASTLANALASTPVAFTDNGTGPFTIQIMANILGSYRGEEAHLQLTTELAAHTHTLTVNGNVNGSSYPSQKADGSGSPFPDTTSSTGSSTPFNVMQPTTYMNVYIKL